MGRVSRRKVKKDIFNKINEQFIKTISKMETKRKIKFFLEELLTKEEKVMLSKRLALIFMLERGYSFNYIKNTLKMSGSTLGRIRRDIKKGRYKSLVNQIKKEKKKDEFWSDLERLLRVGMPPMSGLGRWREPTYEERAEYRRRDRKI